MWRKGHVLAERALMVLQRLRIRAGETGLEGTEPGFGVFFIIFFFLKISQLSDLHRFFSLAMQHHPSDGASKAHGSVSTARVGNKRS